MSQGGKHGHTIRQLRRRIDAVLEQEQERRKPPPPPVSPEHAEIRVRVERAIDAVLEQIPEDMDLEEALAESDELANAGAHIVVLIRQEQDFLAGQGVDPRPYTRY